MSPTVPPRWRKVITDILGNRARSILVVFSIAVGVFAIGLVINIYVLVSKDLDTDFQSTRPHSSQLYVSGFGDNQLEVIRKIPGVGAADGRNSVSANVEVGPGTIKPISFTGIPPLAQMTVDQIRPNEAGQTLELRDHEVFIERTSLPLLNVKPGDVIRVSLNNEKVKELTVAGIVHDVNVFTFGFATQVTAYVTPETIQWLGGSSQYSTLNIVVGENQKDESYVREVTQRVVDKLESSGMTVYMTVVITPGEHPANSTLTAVFVLLGGMGLLTVFLSGFLVVNTINALLTQHTRQIGIMKAIGANSNQITLMYLIEVLGLGLGALAISLPSATILSFLASGFFADLFNFNLQGFRLIPEAAIAQAVISLLTPVLSALFPVMNGTRITVREAISNYGLGNSGASNRKFSFNRWFNEITAHLEGLSRPLLISLRNTFRRKGRLALTLSTLTLAGAIFISVFNIQASMMVEVEKTLGYFLSNINLSLDRPYRMEKISPILKAVPGVTYFEPWALASGYLLSEDKFTSEQMVLFAPPNDSTLISPTISSGRWIVPGDENAIVISNQFLQKRPDLKVGQEVLLRINQKDYPFQIIGVYDFAGNMIPPIFYSSYDYVSRIEGLIDQAYQLRILTVADDPQTENRISEEIKEAFKKEGIKVTTQTGSEVRAANASVINALVVLLLAMATLIAVVGGLGLMGTMSMNVLERTREIGVMRSIGANDGAIARLVIIEGMIIGLISWALGALLSLPISQFFCISLGSAMLNTPMGLVISTTGFFSWMIIILVLSALASLLPARSASRLTIREVLAYE